MATRTQTQPNKGNGQDARLPDDGRRYEVIERLHVSPAPRTKHQLVNNQYMPFGHFERGGVIQSSLLPNLRLPLDEICEL
jgi:hypothetical protein